MLWDAALDALDRYLKIHQDEHLRAVDEAGRSATTYGHASAGSAHSA